MLRRIALALMLLVSMVVLLPLATSTAHNLRFQFSSNSTRFRRHSRAWWRRHRALLRRRQAIAARRRAMLAQAGQMTKTSDNHASVPGAFALPEGMALAALPSGWSPGSATSGTSSFRIAPTAGMAEAHASLAIVAPARANAGEVIGRPRNVLAGVSFTDLRRNVIDKMISAGGWVVNDRQREIGGHRVFQVIAQTPASSDGKPEQVWNFYFTEVNGRIYSLTTRTGGTSLDKLAADSEKFLSNVQPVETSRNK